MAKSSPDREKRLVIATYNVNNVRRRLDNLLNWLAHAAEVPG
jgi:hypothetical protein